VSSKLQVPVAVQPADLFERGKVHGTSLASRLTFRKNSF